MGFDMQFVEHATSLPEWYEPLYGEMPGWYQLTTGGMAEVAAAMAAAGLLDEQAACPDLPDWPPLGLSAKRAEELKPYVFNVAEFDKCAEPHERAILTAFLARFSDATGRQSESPGRVPAYKFGSNDGWLVTPNECREIANGLTRALAERRHELLGGLKLRGYQRTAETLTDLLEPWAAYNRVAADHGGYRVW